LLTSVCNSGQADFLEILDSFYSSWLVLTQGLHGEIVKEKWKVWKMISIEQTGFFIVAKIKQIILKNSDNIAAL